MFSNVANNRDDKMNKLNWYLLEKDHSWMNAIRIKGNMNKEEYHMSWSLYRKNVSLSDEKRNSRRRKIDWSFKYSFFSTGKNCIPR